MTDERVRHSASPKNSVIQSGGSPPPFRHSEWWKRDGCVSEESPYQICGCGRVRIGKLDNSPFPGAPLIEINHLYRIPQLNDKVRTARTDYCFILTTHQLVIDICRNNLAQSLAIDKRQLKMISEVIKKLQV